MLQFDCLVMCKLNNEIKSKISKFLQTKTIFDKYISYFSLEQKSLDILLAKHMLP